MIIGSQCSVWEDHGLRLTGLALLAADCDLRPLDAFAPRSTAERAAHLAVKQGRGPHSPSPVGSHRLVKKILQDITMPHVGLRFA